MSIKAAKELIHKFASSHTTKGDRVELNDFGAVINLGIVGPYLTLLTIGTDAAPALLVRHESNLKFGWEDHPKFEKTWKKYAKLFLRIHNIDLGWGPDGHNGPALYMTLAVPLSTTSEATLLAIEYKLQELSQALDTLFSRKLR